MPRTCFLSGAQGCIGAWVVKALVERGDAPVVFDLSSDARRLRLLLDEEQVARVRFVQGDLTDYAALRSAMADCGAGSVIHLAALQVPFCKADPARGAKVNVLGTIHVFEAAREQGVERVVYASSAAVYGPDGEDPHAVTESDACDPLTHYGVYKRANEGNARVYWLDQGLSSVGLRPLTVYGVARDQGLTSDLSRALQSAVLGRPFTIRFSGATDCLYAADAADAFVACADRAPEGAHVFNLHGEAVEVRRFVELADSLLPADRRGLISVEGGALPIASAMDDRSIRERVGGLRRTSLEDGIRDTIERFQALVDEGRMDTTGLEA